MGRPKVSTASVPKQRAGKAENLASYVYGIVPADLKSPPETEGLGEPAGKVRLVRHGEIAALVSDVDAGEPLGRPGDYYAHERLLDATAAKSPVLPFRFGAVLSDADAVVRELLEPHHDEFSAALRELEGMAEFIVRGRYVERALLSEILAESPEAESLRRLIRGRDEMATRDERIRLGEIVAESIEAKRDMDTQLLVDGISGHYEMAVVRQPTHEQDAVHVALLVETGRQRELEETLTAFGERWEGRVDLRLLGPLAPYDFVTTQQEV
ncbi:GvpL/GvpF family gas vesicle protein [Nonomuraea maritima]|uniref:GvpL/GvpF family gas vesicle protein n=1 Tax=Nonomuraea maritima TaxID=683260 RepID=UPI003718A6CA